ncbi:ATP-dependent helicase [Auritidibacter ignavus]|uniref:ATP-dependent helicase n=1 Tax=Auritidibacter ignavus TaxID=678932 RepID=UPI0024B90D80|nr:ATP-dependent DNA helicase [Auritidibacter ignavus]WHS35274.1 ATP-dependent DNA helicase [Auritidibacter ignavus]
MEPLAAQPQRNTWGDVRFSAEELADILQSAKPPQQRMYPTKQQRAVIEYGPDPLLVVAGAGSGKTRTMTDRVIWLTANGFVRPEEILGVTFTRKAAGELAARVNAAIENLASHESLGLTLDRHDPGQASVSTYHSYANALVADYGLRIGVEPDSEMIGEARSFQIIAEIVANWEADVSELDFTESSLISAVKKLAAEANEHLVKPHEIKEHVIEILESGQRLDTGAKRPKYATEIFNSLRVKMTMADIVARYAQVKKDHNLMDYGDLVYYAQLIASTIPEAAASEREKYKVVLLDEFQDTSHAQMMLFSSLFGPQSSQGAGHCVTAVGDPNQSIYGFRGASAGQLGLFPEYFPAVRRADDDRVDTRAPADILPLSVAWRNRERILRGANAIIGQLDGEPTTGRPVPVQELSAGVTGEPGRVVINWFKDSEDEARTLADTVADCLGITDPGSNQPHHTEKSAAILCRRKADFLPLVEALEARGVPYEILGMTGLVEVPAVVEVLSLARVVAAPQENEALVRILSNARWRIGTADLWALNRYARGLVRHGRDAQPPSELRSDDPEQIWNAEKLAEALVSEDAEEVSLIEALYKLPPIEEAAHHGFTEEGLQRLHRVADLLVSLQELRSLDLPEFFRMIARRSGIEAEVLAHPGTELSEALQHLEALYDVVDEFSQGLNDSLTSDLSGFLAWIETAEAEEKGLALPAVQPRPGAVQLLTVHSSKGLEWDAVFVPGLSAGKFPSEKPERWTSTSSGALPWGLRHDIPDEYQWPFDQAETLKEWSAGAGNTTFSTKDQDRVTYHRLSENVKIRNGFEEKRLAYVAFTRPKHLLWLSGSHWVGTKKKAVEQSEFLTIFQGLDGVETGHWVDSTDPEVVGDKNPRAEKILVSTWPVDPLDGASIYQINATDFYDGVYWIDDRAGKPLVRHYPRRQAVTQAAQWVTDARETSVTDIEDHELAQRVQWAQPDEDMTQSSEVHLPSHLSASAFISLVDDPHTVAKSLKRPMPRRPIKAARTGTLVHQWIEEHFASQRSGITGLLDFEDPVEDADQVWDEQTGVTTLRENFLNTRWAQRSPAFIEAGVETTVGSVTIRGRIDAVFRNGGDHPDQEFDPTAQWELVDWKTGMVPSTPDDLEHKGLQLALYRLAWSRLHDIPLANISGRFVYLAHGEERTPVNLADAEQLEALLAQALEATEPHGAD